MSFSPVVVKESFEFHVVESILRLHALKICKINNDTIVSKLLIAIFNKLNATRNLRSMWKINF